MGTGWRRAFCTTIPRNSSDSSVLGDVQQNPNPTPRSSGKLAFFKTSSASNPSTPRLQSNWSLRSRNSNNGGGADDTVTDSNVSTPRLRLRAKTNDKSDGGGDDGGKFQSSVIDNLNITPRLRCKTNMKKPKSSLLGSNPSSPRSPFSIFKSSLGFSRSNCGLCLQSVKTGHKTAIFTAECSHTFHFPCISKHVKKEKVLECPICKSAWRDGSFLAIHKLQSNNEIEKLNDDKTENSITTPKSKHDLSRSQETCVKPKAYDDDEPLRTPRAGGGGIIPIPEAVEENEDVDVDEEFKGFFVNPVSSSTADEFRRDFKNVEVMLMSEVAVISSTQSHETYAVVLKVKAPPPSPPVGAAHMLNQSRRAPIDLVAVLDVSASMGGAKLQMLKRAMRLVISSLGSTDRLSIVAFSASPKRLLPLRRMTSKGQRSARRIIDQLTCSRGTCAGEALRKATKVLEDRRERNPVASIILLSDGQEEHVTDNNNSNQRQPSCHVSSTRFAHVEIPVHTLEKKPSGYSHQTNDPAENAFTKCVGGLLSVVAQDLRIQLGVAPGSDPAQITAVYSCNGKPTVLNSGSVRFGDLYAEEEREVLVEMRVPRSNSGSHHVLSARCSYNDPATQETVYGGEKALLVARAQTVRSSCSPKIERLRNLFIATRAVAESRLLVEHNKLTTAHHLLSSARGLLMQSISAEEFVKGLESELMDVEWRVQYQQQMVQQQGVMMVDENGEPLTPTSAWRAAEKLAKVAVMKKSMNRVSDLHGFENARF
ncbi:probable E3 ubiquitin-protein ligase EDA40 isoform X1 [Cynara cardunculus var. scolymus]|uniref:von Willebrand factor, type A n=1 Tax=Cynara cardunculus var. scolymus TaxID=59895 RepID=A0A103XZD3_CYNCS|nr:probable E3 ubiquitin-protein ligase EDA40 isoform X1 [Cynara cardunculus var. scolymus]KVH99673.1 von Willebrand factor, type A [Cynara cardunculus var. scolymus]